MSYCPIIEIADRQNYDSNLDTTVISSIEEDFQT